MIHTNSWKPDTCGCKIEYTWDDAVPNENRIHTASDIKKGCPEHSGLLTPVDMLTTLVSENSRKNLTLSELMSYVELGETVEINGKSVKRFIKDIVWSFSGSDDSRVLTIDLSDTPLTTQQKNAIQTFANNKFGNGKIVIQ